MELVKAVEMSFGEMKAETLDNVWVTLQMTMEAVMGDGGGNQYKLGHMGKESLCRQGKMVENLVCDLELINTSINQVDQSPLITL